MAAGILGRGRGPSWKRVGPLSGPANVLDGRWRVQRDGRTWEVRDLDSDRRVDGAPTMAAARRAAERRAGYR